MSVANKESALLLHDEEQIYLVEDKPAVGQRNINKETLLRIGLAEESKLKLISFWVVLILSFICILIMTIVIFVSKTLSLERKLFLGLIIGIVMVGIQIMMCISRSEPHALSIFTIICAFTSGLTLGMSICYI
ncbi:MAG: hypothetical protein K2Q45_02395 [Nitrosomonas sp.]|nr:hypothetical protein [Nitrosomonas sp.]